ncbi:hypothetical protein Ddc_08402 [Ditylenchus destructor]|nr:hypothetical protein Ddc_08402 [Ditylenchus destructor]
MNTDGENSIEALVRNITLSGVVAVAILLCAMVVCLLAMVLSLTFDCWWTVGDFCNVGRELGSPQRQRLISHAADDVENSDDRSDSHLLRPPISPAILTQNQRCGRDGSKRPPWLLRLQNGKLHNVKAYACDLDLEMI